MGRNKVMDYAYLDEELNGRQLYEMGLVSKVIPDALVKEAGLTYAKKMATTAPLAVRCFKEEVRRALYPNVDETARPRGSRCRDCRYFRRHVGRNSLPSHAANNITSKANKRSRL